ncbi:MAG: hypothetical protein ACRERV_08445 [Methylococcales bacterium]
MVNTEASDIAVLSGEGSAVYFDIDPTISYRTADLRVSSPENTVLKQLFEPGFVPYYPFGGVAFQNGIYRYEITLNPIISEQVQKALETAKEAANGSDISPIINHLRATGELPDKMVQSGSFQVQDGVVLPPQTEE